MANEFLRKPEPRWAALELTWTPACEGDHKE